MSRLFGTDGVRGVANVELTPELSFKLGLYGGAVLSNGAKGKVIVGRDTRQSGDMLQAALSSGLMATGLDVVDLGVVPTPAVAYLVRKHGYLAGVVISASHNPFEYNGIKFFDKDGLKLKDEIEDEIESLINTNVSVDIHEGDSVGILEDGTELVGEYIEYLKSLLDLDLTGIKIALDCGNGALSKLAPKVMEDLGAEVFAINTEPDGRNINRNCGSTNPELISNLVKETGSFLGFSFDGDADRIIATDEQGRYIDGDHMLAIFARALKGKSQLNNNTVVGTVMTNIGLDIYLESIGVDIVKTAVGDRYVLEEMLANDYVVGGEQSGHIIFLKHNTTGDGLATGLHLLELILESGMKPSELNDLMTNYPQVLINANVDNAKKYKYLENKTVKEAIEKIETEFGKSGRVVIRPSGTEPLVRVMIEGKEQDEITKVAKELAELIEKELS